MPAPEGETTTDGTDRPERFGPYLVTHSFKSFWTRHEAVGHAAILGREWDFEPKVIGIGERVESPRISAVLDAVDGYDRVSMKPAVPDESRSVGMEEDRDD